MWELIRVFKTQAKLYDMLRQTGFVRLKKIKVNIILRRE